MTRIFAGIATAVTIIGGIILFVQYFSGASSLPEFIGKSPRRNSELTSQKSDQLEMVPASNLVVDPAVSEKEEILPTRGEKPAVSLLVVRRKGSMGPPRVSLLSGEGLARRERVLVRLEGEYDLSSQFDRQSGQVSLARLVTEKEILPTQRIDVATLDIKERSVQKLSLVLSNCDYEPETRIRSIAVNGTTFYVYFDSACRFAKVAPATGSEGMASLRSFGAFRPTPVFAWAPLSGKCIGNSCVSACSGLDDGQYEKYLYDFGHTGAPRRCSTADLKPAGLEWTTPEGKRKK